MYRSVTTSFAQASSPQSPRSPRSPRFGSNIAAMQSQLASKEYSQYDTQTPEELKYERARGLVGKYRLLFDSQSQPGPSSSLSRQISKSLLVSPSVKGLNSQFSKPIEPLPSKRASISYIKEGPKVPAPIDAPAKPPIRREGSRDVRPAEVSETAAAGIEPKVEKSKVEVAKVKNVFDAIRAEAPIITEEQIQLVVKRFDENNDQMVNRSEFSNLVAELLANKDKPYFLTEEQKDEIFNALDLNNDGNIDIDEFRVNWNNWVTPINQPRSAFIIVDVQNDFISGSLSLLHCPAKQDAALVVPVINKVRANSKFDLIVYTLDSHPANHCSFHSQVFHHELADNTPVSAADAKLFDVVKLKGPPPVDQKLWPDHCVQNSWGEELHEGLFTDDSDVIVKKGSNPEVDSYSAFWDNAKLSQTTLLTILKDKAIDTVFICGLAYDVCVGSTALHAIEHGFRTFLVEDCCAGVTTEGIAEMKKALIESGCSIVQSDQVPGLVSGTDRESTVALSQIRRIRAAKLHHQRLSASIRGGLFNRAEA